MSWIYEFKDDDGIGTYTGKHGGRESLGTRINRHFGLDAEHSRHADSVQAHAVHPDDLDYEEQQAIKNANGGQGMLRQDLQRRGLGRGLLRRPQHPRP